MGNEIGDQIEKDKGEIVPIIQNSASVSNEKERAINILRRHIREKPKKALLARHRLWMDGIQHEYPLPYLKFNIGVYIRYFNQTKYENYIEQHKMQFKDDIAMCPNWTLVDFYIDKGMIAPRMEYSKEWCRLLTDCFNGKVDLIVTQKVSSVSSDPDEMTFIARILAAQKKPVGIYFISEDIYTLASYYTRDLHDYGFLSKTWQTLPDDDIDLCGMGSETHDFLELEENTNRVLVDESHLLEKENGFSEA